MLDSAPEEIVQYRRKQFADAWLSCMQEALAGRTRVLPCEESEYLSIGGVIAIVRHAEARFILLMAEALFAGGVRYFKAIRGPLSDVNLLGGGGISSANLEDCLAAGAVGAGVGGSLCRMQSMEDAARITQEAQALTAPIAQYQHRARR